MNWYLHVLQNYAVFTGRARRQEYWMFFLFNLIITVALGIVDTIFGGAGVLGGLYALALLIPSIAVAVRRLHDSGRTGWWVLIGLVPAIGFIVLIIFMVLDSQPGTNEYGENPKGA